MKKVISLSIISLSLLGLIGCGQNQVEGPKHECRLFDVEAKVATCVEPGIIAHKHCIYCNKRYVDGKEIEEYTLPVDASNHVNLINHDEVPAKCNETGVKSYQECNDCHKILLNGAVATEEELVLPSLNGGHDFGENSICKNCDAYQITYGGENYLCDASTRTPFKENTAAKAHEAANKADPLAQALVTRMTFATQGGGGMSVTNTEYTWRIKQTTSTAPSNTFTRFALGDANNKAFKGKAIVAFDALFNIDMPMARFGARVVTSGATDDFKTGQPKLFGVNANEENNASREMKTGDIYRFVYAFETTAEDQLIQLFTCSNSKNLDVTIQNLYVYLLGEGTASAPTGEVLSFGKIN